MDLYQTTLVGISTERKGLTKGENGSPIIKKGPTAGKMVIRMENKATVMTIKLVMTSMRSAFCSAMMTFDALVHNVEEMIDDERGEDEMTEAEVRKYKQFVEDSKKSLYPHCEKYCSWMGMKLLQLKDAHGWTVPKHYFCS